MDFNYLWDYIAFRFRWIAVGYLVLVCGTLLFKLGGVQANYSNFLWFWSIFALVVGIIPFSGRNGRGPDPVLLFPDYSQPIAITLSVIMNSILLIVAAGILIWDYATFIQ